jgi:hypothetical protein
MKRSRPIALAVAVMLALGLFASLPAAFGAGPAATPSVRITPRTINLKSHGQFVQATIDLGSLNASDVVATSVVIAAVNGVPTTLTASSVATSPDSTSVVVADFSRSDLQALLTPGAVTITVSWSMADGTSLSASDTVRVVNPGGGNGKSHGKAKGHGKTKSHGKALGHSKTHGKSNGHGKGHSK